jgi:hypothetical protein
MPTESPSPDKESIVKMPDKFANLDKYPASFSSHRKDVRLALPNPPAGISGSILPGGTGRTYVIP